MPSEPRVELKGSIAREVTPQMSTPGGTLNGKNIVLCSDGTGNSAGVVAITNVRRFYQALDLSDPTKQIAFYDDGVGSGGSKVVRILGGALGIGLARNVRQLYRFLCETYQPNDRIYLFGFSRGAFTVRVLAAVIAHCGIVNKGRLTGSETTVISMASAVAWAYRCFRGNHKAGLLSQPFRWLRNRFTSMPTNAQDFRCRFSHECKETVEVLGLWDTVSAYGMPFDELARVVNTFIYRIRFQSQNISGKIRRVYHALALDDERHTFTPLLIHSVDKSGPTGVTTHVEQVWFAGMHSDVGGGYANCNLALIPLTWMLHHAKSAGLHFHEAAVAAIVSQASVLGDMHDSRSGLGRIYRPRIRNLTRLCAPAANTIVEDPGIPVVHSSAVERIARGIQGYAPAAIPGNYYDSKTLAETEHTSCDTKTLDLCRRRLYFAQLVALSGLMNTGGGRWALDQVVGGLSTYVPECLESLLQVFACLAFRGDELVWLVALAILWWWADFANRRLQAASAAAWGETLRRRATAAAVETDRDMPVADDPGRDGNRD